MKKKCYPKSVEVHESNIYPTWRETVLYYKMRELNLKIVDVTFITKAKLLWISNGKSKACAVLLQKDESGKKASRFNGKKGRTGR